MYFRKKNKIYNIFVKKCKKMNNRVTVLDKEFEISITAKQISDIINGLAARINNDLKNKDVVFLGILNGSFIFAADLFRKINFPSKITFLKLASYDGLSSSGKIKRLIGLNESIKGKTLVIIEDIIDSGNTLEHIIMQLRGYEPKEIKIATLVFKPMAYKKDFKIDYIGMEIPNDFIVGYGLDYDGYGRNLENIYTLVDDVNNKDLKNFIIFGSPGAGKGTQASKLAEKYNLIHISTGDILRQEISKNTKLGKIAKNIIDKGEFISDEIIIDIIADFLDKNKKNGFVFDGFPRTLSQAKIFDKMLKEKNLKIEAVIDLNIDEETVKKRMIRRGKIYGRIDDLDENTIKHRLDIYNEITKPIINYYKKNKNIITINASKKIDEVFNQIIKKIN